MKTIPTLSTVGNPKAPQELCAKLIMYYNESNHSQSDSFFGMVRSLAAAIKEFQHHPDRLTSKITNDLEEILGNYFDNVNIDAKVIDNSDGTYNVAVSGTYRSKGTVYQINQVHRASV